MQVAFNSSPVSAVFAEEVCDFVVAFHSSSPRMNSQPFSLPSATRSGWLERRRNESNLRQWFVVFIPSEVPVDVVLVLHSW